MRLIELNPRWISYQGNRLGITFDCPHCKTQRLAVSFHHDYSEINRTIDIDMEVDLIHSVNPDTKIWTETNPEPDTFENLTLTPSIDCSQSGHWHGFIVDGNIS